MNPDRQKLYPPLPPEAELILLCCRVDGAGRHAERIDELLRRPLDWDYLLEMVSIHGVAGFLRSELRRRPPELVPDRPKKELEDLIRHMAADMLRLRAELERSLDLLNRAEIPTIAYKGPALAAALYENPIDRPSSDLDLIVRREDAERATKLFLADGYGALDPFPQEGFLQVLDEDCEVGLRHPKRRVLVELHWDVLPDVTGVGLDPSELWKRAQPDRFDGASILSLPPDILMIVLAVHAGEKHHWKLTKWIVDIARLSLQFEPGDWPLLEANARRIGKLRVVDLGLFLAHKLLGAQLPEATLKRCSNKEYAAHGALTLGRLFRRGSGLPGFSEWESYVESFESNGTGRARGRTGIASRLRYGAAVMRPEWNDRRSVRLPNWASPLYPLIRAARLARVLGPGLLKRLR